jgi:hypothetical protein
MAEYIEREALIEELADDVMDTITESVTVQEDCKACAEATQNCIVKLQEQIAELRSAQEWISADYPPKENGDYFIYTQDGDMGTAYFKYGRWLAGGSVVTRWMPLPQPPKGE